MGLNAIELSAAESRHLRRTIEKAVAKCANEVDAACRGYDRHSVQQALALTVIDHLTLAVITGFFPELSHAREALARHAQHCQLRLDELAKRGPGLVQ